MAMTQKHYERVAEIIKDEREAWAGMEVMSESTVKTATFVVANRLATMFAHDNAQFDRDKFMKACGIE